MSTNNPDAAFGAPPAEDMIDPAAGYQVPDEKDDPYRPIGTYDEDGKLVAGTSNKATVPGRCTAIKDSTGPKGKMLVFSFVCTEGVYAGRDFDSYVSFSPAARFKVVETYTALGLPLTGPYPRKQAIGVNVLLNLQDEEYQGRWSAKIKSVVAHPKSTKDAPYRGSAAAALS